MPASMEISSPYQIRGGQKDEVTVESSSRVKANLLKFRDSFLCRRAFNLESEFRRLHTTTNATMLSTSS